MISLLWLRWNGGGGMVDLANWSRLRFVLASLRSWILLAHSLITVVNMKILENSEFLFFEEPKYSSAWEDSFKGQHYTVLYLKTQTLQQHFVPL